MATSPRLDWPYPDEYQDPWYTPFAAMVDAMDASGYASREDRQIVFTDGGVWSFSINNTNNLGTLTWSAAFNIPSPITGFLETVEASAVQLQDGQSFYVELVRGTVGNVVLQPNVATQIPTDDNALLICLRKGAMLYFRNGKVLTNGDTNIALFTSNSGGSAFRVYERGSIFPAEGGVNFASGVCGFTDNPGQDRTDISILGTTGQSLFTTVTLATNQATFQDTAQVAGDYSLNPGAWGLAALSGYTYNFVALAAVTSSSSPALTGTVILQDLTTSTQICSLSFTGTALSKQTFSTAITEVGAEHIYEVRFYVTGGSTDANQIVLAWAGFEIYQTL